MSGTRFSNANGTFRATLRVALGIVLISPYLIWLAEVPSWSWPPTAEWMPALRSAVIQAFVSAVGAFAFGFILFGAFQSWSAARGRQAAELALLFPNMIPPLFFVLSLASLAGPFGGLPFGFASVVVAHVFLNGGLVAVALDRLVQAKLGGLAETAWVLGVSARGFWRHIGWPLLRADLACVFLFVFSLCFTSFSIPLLISGEHAVTLEVAIYDTIRMEGRWDKAVLLAALQSLFLFVMAWLLPQSFWPQRPARRALTYLSWPRVRGLVFLPVALLVWGWAQGLLSGLAQTMDLEIWQGLIEAALTTAALGIGVGLAHLLAFLAAAFVLPHAQLERFLNGYLAPSPAVTGFGLLLLPVDEPVFNFVRLVFALTLISFPLLYRWLVHSALGALRGQIGVARALGASWSSILFEITWPQAAPVILRASGVGALWACGDFALSGILLDESYTLPLLIENLLGTYRLEGAQLMLMPLITISLAVYSLFAGASRYVTR